MVKSKKMSKTSIAVIVLALLLVLSLVMGMTGAWFTDYKTGSQPQSINFGNIDIDAEVTEIAAGNWAFALPGDTASLAGSVTVKADSEDMYVLVTPNSQLKQGDNALALYYDVTGEEGSEVGDTAKPIMEISFAAGTLPATWAVVTNYAGPGVLYYVAKTNADKVLPLEGTVTINQNVKNIVYNAAGEEVRLNVDSPALAFSMQIGLEAKAVQARHLAEGGASISAEQAAIVVAAMSTLAAQA